MSLFTLLEAARYLEYKSEASARGEEPHDYTTFTQLSAGGTTIVTTPASNHGNQNNNSNKDPSSGNNVPNGIINCRGSNSTNVSSNTSHINNFNGGVGSNNHANLGGAGQHQQQQQHHHLQQQPQQQQQHQHTNSNSSSSSNSPTLSFTLGTTLGGTAASLGSVGVLSTTGNAAAALSSAGYRQRSGSAASRQRTDSLSSHDDGSRDPHNKQSRRSGGAGTREVHNKLEKNRRAHLKECFESLKKQLPNIQDDRKTSNLTILRSALRYIQNLKKKEREFEQQMEQLAREKISAQQRLATLRRDGSSVLPLHDNHSPHQLPHQSLSHHLQHQQHISTSSPSATTPTATTTSATNSRDTATQIGVVVANTHSPGIGSIDVQRRTLFVTAGTSDPAAEKLKLVANELKRRGSVSPDNETTTTASECGNLSDYEGDEFESVSQVGNQQQTLQNSTNNNHSLSTAANSTSVKRERNHHQHHSHPLHHHHHRLGGTKTTSTTAAAAGTPTPTATTTMSKTAASSSAATATTVEMLTAASVSAMGGGSLALVQDTNINNSSSRSNNTNINNSSSRSSNNNNNNNNNNHKKDDDRSSCHANDVTSFNNLNSNAHTKSRQANSFNKEMKSLDGAVVDTKEERECKPITISVTSGNGASVIATAPAVNPIYQQATAGLHKTCRREIKEETLDRKASIVRNGLGAAGGASQAIAFVTTSAGTTAKTLTESSNEGVGPQTDVSPATTTVTMEPPRAIFTPGNQKTVLPTYLPNTGNLATLLHAANTVSYIKATSAVNNSSTGAGGASHGELTVTVSSAPMVSTGGSSMVASVVPPTMVPSMTSSMVPSMGQIPLMCKPGSVVRLAASGHLVQPLTLVQQIPTAAAANGVSGGTNGVTGKAGTTGSSQQTIAQATGHTHHPHATQQATTQLFLTQTGPAQGGAFKAAGTGVAPPGSGQPVTSMATVITQAAPSQAGHHGTQIVTGVAPIGKVQLGGATATLSIKPVSQFPLISGQQFITTSSQSLKPVVVVSVPQTSTQ